MEISDELFNQLKKLGLISSSSRVYNVGNSDYSKHLIQPWSIWLDYNLDPFDADIIKRVLRTKMGEDEKMDYEKIIHICLEKLRQMGWEYAQPVLMSWPKTNDDSTMLFTNE